MKQTLFKAEQFTPTKWNTAEDKAKFANHLVRFVQSGFKKTMFPEWFYTRLSLTFGHIAHYNQWTFYNHFFECGDEMKQQFLSTLKTGGGYGDPEYTYSDVERLIHKWAKGQRLS